MKDILLQFAAYHLWANGRLLDCITALPVELQVKELPSSFPSLYATLLHMWNAESIWWQRMKMQEVVTPPGNTFVGSAKVLGDALLQQNKVWAAWIENASLTAMGHVFHYQNTKKEQFKQPVYQVLLHIFNHGTYHRGQLVTLLRALNIQTIPATDFIVWSRSLK